MNRFFTSLRRSVTGLFLGFSLGLTLSGAALAEPIPQTATRFHVQIDSSSLSGEGWLAFTLLPGALPASGVQVQLSQFSGSWQSDSLITGDVQGSFPALRIGNSSGYNEVLQSVRWGGWLGFDLSFSGDYAQRPGDIGSTLGIALLSADQLNYVGTDGNLLEFALMPQQVGVSASLTLNNLAPGLAQVMAVPEPDALALSGLGLLALLVSRRPRKPR